MVRKNTSISMDLSTWKYVDERAEEEFMTRSRYIEKILRREMCKSNSRK